MHYSRFARDDSFRESCAMRVLAYDRHSDRDDSPWFGMCYEDLLPKTASPIVIPGGATHARIGIFDQRFTVIFLPFTGKNRYPADFHFGFPAGNTTFEPDYETRNKNFITMAR
jgi:hypothetical protein